MAKLLLETGMMAAWGGETSDARTILEGLQLSRPDSPLPAIGLAIAYLNEGRNQLAITVLEDALQMDEECDAARCHLALACKVSGFDDRSRKLCEQVIASGRNPTAMELASTLLAIPTEAGKTECAMA
jgi:Tfp pilus assembly protein PilF